MGVRNVIVTSRSFGKADPAPLEDLAAAGITVVRATVTHDREELESLLRTAEAWIAGTAPIPADLLELAPALKVIARYGVGIDGVPLAAATRHGIWVTNTPGANSDSVADLTVALMLDAIRHVTHGSLRVRDGDWGALSGRELGALTIGIFGFGRIGRGVARRVAAFGARVLATDPQVSDADFELVEPEQLVTECDVITLHLPGGTVLVDKDWIGRVRPGTVLVNTARADLVDEDAVAEALTSGRLACYACDMLSGEHGAMPASPLMDEQYASRTIITPHLGAQTAEAVARMGEIATSNVLAALAGRTPPNPVNAPWR